MTMVQAGPLDAACCPGRFVTRVWKFTPADLEEAKAAGGPTRLTLSAIAGIQWTLRYWDWNTPAPRQPAVALVYTDGRLAGNDECNLYHVAVRVVGSAPAGLWVGSEGSAGKKPCPGILGEIQRRFLRRLALAQSRGSSPDNWP